MKLLSLPGTLRTMRISYQIGLGYGLVLILLLVILAAALATQHEFTSRLNRMVAVDGAKAEKVVDVTRRAYDSALSMRNLSVINNPADLGAEYQRLVEHLQVYDREWLEFQKLVGANGASHEEETQLAQVKATAQAAREIMQLARAGSRGVEADDLAIGVRTELRRDLARWNGALADWISAMNSMRQLEVEASRKGVQDTNRASSSAGSALVAVAATAMLIGVAAAWSVTRSVGRGVGAAAAAAHRIAGGDLAHPIEVKGGGEVAGMLAALEKMRHQLHDMATQVQEVARHIGHSSGEIASSNLDLSHRTEDTASRLQAAADEVTRLTRGIDDTALTAEQADEVSSKALGAATQGAAAVGHVVGHMREISDSSQRIGEIISVIDSIAFRTNILALNAAVESAHAGEQGRGFAVVAGEVRALAQRCAEAADEIRQLIGASQAKVEAGSSRVKEAGQRMDQIVEAVTRLCHLVVGIRGRTIEQRDGMNGVNSIVAHLEAVTQQNAAMVEQSAAAAEALHVQTGRLTRAAAAFRLSAAQGVSP